MTPAIPTSVNETIDTSQWNSALHASARVAPVKAPTNSDGANVPPMPPAALVDAMAITLKNMVATTKRMTTHSMLRNR